MKPILYAIAGSLALTAILTLTLLKNNGSDRRFDTSNNALAATSVVLDRDRSNPQIRGVIPPRRELLPRLFRCEINRRSQRTSPAQLMELNDKELNDIVSACEGS